MSQKALLSRSPPVQPEGHRHHRMLEALDWQPPFRKQKPGPELSRANKDESQQVKTRSAAVLEAQARGKGPTDDRRVFLEKALVATAVFVQQVAALQEDLPIAEQRRLPE